MNKKLLLKIFLPIVFIFGFLIVSLGNIASFVAVNWLEGQGLEAEIASIELALLDGQISVQGLNAKNAEGRGVSLSRLFVDISWQPLLDNTLAVDLVELAGLQLDSAGTLEALDEIAGLDLQQLLGAPAPEPAIEQAPAEPFGLSLQSIKFADWRICHFIRTDETQLCAGFDALELSGPIAVVGEAISVEADLVINDLLIEDQQPLLSIDDLAIEGLALSSVEKVLVSAFSLDDLSALTIDDVTLLAVDELSVANIAYTPSQVDIEKLFIDGVGLELIQSKDGSFQFQPLLDRYLPPAAENQTAQAQTPEDSTEALVVNLAELEISSSEDLAFTDNSGEKPVRLGGRINSLKISNISTVATPEQSQLSLDLALFNKGTVALEGAIDNLLDPRNGQLDTGINNVDLRPVSRYVEDSVGQQIRSGQLTTAIKVGLDAGNIDGDVDINIQQFRLRKVNASKSEGLDAALGVPVNTAVNLLRSKDNSIALSVPLSGDIDNPEFDISKVIAKAVSSALTSTIINFYTPFGLLNLADSVFDITALKFEPIDFEAGQFQLLDPDNNKQLDKIKSLMKERPQLFVTVCGVSNAEDLEALGGAFAKKLKDDAIEFNDDERKQLIELERKRSLAVIDALVAEGVDADKLVECESEFNRKGPKGVEISI